MSPVLHAPAIDAETVTGSSSYAGTSACTGQAIYLGGMVIGGGPSQIILNGVGDGYNGSIQAAINALPAAGGVGRRSRSWDLFGYTRRN